MALVRRSDQRTCKWCDLPLNAEGKILRCEHCDNHGYTKNCATCIKVRDREG